MHQLNLLSHQDILISITYNTNHAHRNKAVYLMFSFPRKFLKIPIREFSGVRTFKSVFEISTVHTYDINRMPLVAVLVGRDI